MKYAALSYSTKNIGDEIQTIAAKKFLPTIDYFVDRDDLKNAQLAEQTKIILNGWFLGQPSNWPPNEKFDPLFISFHVTHKNGCRNYFSQKSFLNYIKNYEPIGCRDISTLNFLKSLGIECYFSGCLTLTLENPSLIRNDKIYFVDPIHNIPMEEMKRLISRIVPKHLQSEVEIISHWDNRIIPDTPMSKLSFAEQLLKKYATAKLVITSRLHCALPCIAFNTPVYFMDIGYNALDDRNRFEGLLNYVETIKCEEYFIANNFLLKTLSNLFPLNDIVNFEKIRKQIDWQLQVLEKAGLQQIKDVLNKNVTEFLVK